MGQRHVAVGHIWTREHMHADLGGTQRHSRHPTVGRVLCEDANMCTKYTKVHVDECARGFAQIMLGLMFRERRASQAQNGQNWEIER